MLLAWHYSDIFGLLLPSEVKFNKSWSTFFAIKYFFYKYDIFEHFAIMNQFKSNGNLILIELEKKWEKNCRRMGLNYGPLTNQTNAWTCTATTGK